MSISVVVAQSAFSFYVAPRAAPAVVAAGAELPVAPAIEPPALNAAALVALAAIVPPPASPPSAAGIAGTGGTVAAAPAEAALLATAFTNAVTAGAPRAGAPTPVAFAAPEPVAAAAPAASAPPGATPQPPPPVDETPPPTAIAAVTELGATLVRSVVPMLGTIGGSATQMVGLAPPAAAPERLAPLPAPPRLAPQNPELAMAIPPGANAPAAPPQPAFAPVPPRQPSAPAGIVVAEIDPPAIQLILRDTIDPAPPAAAPPRRNPPPATARATGALEAGVVAGIAGAATAVNARLGVEAEASRSSRSGPDPSGSEPAVEIVIEGVLEVEVALPDLGILSGPSTPEAPSASGGLLGIAVDLDLPLLPAL